jgi:hypothetical protein
MMTASLRSMTGQSIRIWPLDQSQRFMSEGDIVPPLTYPAICSTVALVLLSDGGTSPR